jgi:hypothetical protein
VRVEVDERQRAVNGGRGGEHRVGDEVVAAEGEHVRPAFTRRPTWSMTFVSIAWVSPGAYPTSK